MDIFNEPNSMCVLNVTSFIYDYVKNLKENENLGTVLIREAGQDLEFEMDLAQKEKGKKLYKLKGKSSRLKKYSFLVGFDNERIPSSGKRPNPIPIFRGNVKSFGKLISADPDANLTTFSDDKKGGISKMEDEKPTDNLRGRLVLPFHEDHDYFFNQEKANANTERVERIDADELKQKLFELFEKKDSYTIKELRNETKQPEKHLKDVLSKICDKNPKGKGSKQSFYKLKPEFINRAFEITKKQKLI